MEREQIKERIFKVLTESLELELTRSALEDGARLDELFSLDSVATIELIVGLEKEFRITLVPEELDPETVRDMERLAAHVAARLDHE
jgi:acyl carrier protein